VRNCTGRACGSDGCSGSCGTCAAGRFCNLAGTCVLDPPGSCGAPIDISARAQGIRWNGLLYFEDDNSRGINQVRNQPEVLEPGASTRCAACGVTVA